MLEVGTHLIFTAWRVYKVIYKYVGGKPSESRKTDRESERERDSECLVYISQLGIADRFPLADYKHTRRAILC